LLEALNQKKLLNYLKNISLKNPPDITIHNHLLSLVKDFFIVGGMPAVVKSFTKNSSFLQCMRLQESILTAYKNDFGKYAKTLKHKYLQILFKRAPELICRHFKYSKIDPSVKNPAREFKIALENLSSAGLLSQVYSSSANGLPLRSEINTKKFKIIFIDIGLLQRSLGIDYKIFTSKDISQINSGHLSEQFVGQELLSYSDPFLNKKLFFWQREKFGSSAEIDYLFEIMSQIIPIEVKAGSTGSFRSLQFFLKEKKGDLGIRISTALPSLKNKILSLPFYLISEIERFLNIKPLP
jgi:hypothetical protein